MAAVAMPVKKTDKMKKILLATALLTFTLIKSQAQDILSFAQFLFEVNNAPYSAEYTFDDGLIDYIPSNTKYVLEESLVENRKRQKTMLYSKIQKGDDWKLFQEITIEYDEDGFLKKQTIRNADGEIHEVYSYIYTKKEKRNQEYQIKVTDAQGNIVKVYRRTLEYDMNSQISYFKEEESTNKGATFSVMAEAKDIVRINVNSFTANIKVQGATSINSFRCQKNTNGNMTINGEYYGSCDRWAATGNSGSPKYLTVVQNFLYPVVTGIKNIQTESASSQSSIYTINGKRVKEISEPGIYIVNGKKVVK